MCLVLNKQCSLFSFEQHECVLQTWYPSNINVWMSHLPPLRPPSSVLHPPSRPRTAQKERERRGFAGLVWALLEPIKAGLDPAAAMRPDCFTEEGGLGSCPAAKPGAATAGQINITCPRTQTLPPLSLPQGVEACPISHPPPALTEAGPSPAQTARKTAHTHANEPHTASAGRA